MKKTREQKGITLIALIITIVVLLILAVVAINAIKGDGIIRYAENASNDYKEGQNNEALILDHYLGLIDESQSDLIVHEGVIPEGGQYYVAATGTVLNAGENFPTIAAEEDGYAFGDYVYTHYGMGLKSLDEAKEYIKSLNLENSNGMTWEEFLAREGKTEEQYWEDAGLTEKFWEEFEKSNKAYWSVRVIDKTKTEYGAILGKINGSFVTDMCYSKEEYVGSAGTGDGVLVHYYGCFEGCTSLTTAPVIPSCITNMREAFYGCTSLTGEIEINANPTEYKNCFSGTTKDIKIVGSCSEETKAALAATASSGNVTY